MTILTKSEQATALLRELFTGHARITIAQAREAAAERGIGLRTLQRAAHDLGVQTIFNGRNPGIWQFPPQRG